MSTFEILSAPESNAKLALAHSLGFFNVGLSLAPHRLSGYNVCPHATACALSCVGGETVGLARVYPDTVIGGRIRKTRELFQDRDNFLGVLWDDIRRAHRIACKNRQTLALRLNTFSDLPWRRIRHSGGWSIFDKLREFGGDVVCYDYTKDFRRAVDELQGDEFIPWHNVFSRSERNEKQCLEFLGLGGKVAVAFDSPKHDLPEWWKGYPVVDGDRHDLTFLHRGGAVIGLSAKGDNTEDSPFFVRPELTYRVLNSVYV